MSDRRKRRYWSDSEKLEICNQARVPGVSVAQVARRYALNANMLHAWLRDPRFSGEDDALLDVAEEQPTRSPFYEVSLASTPALSLSPFDAPEPDVSPPVGSSGQDGLHALRVDLSLSDGRRVLIEGATSLLAVLSLVEGLSD